MTRKASPTSSGASRCGIDMIRPFVVSALSQCTLYVRQGHEQSAFARQDSISPRIGLRLNQADSFLSLPDDPPSSIGTLLSPRLVRHFLIDKLLNALLRKIWRAETRRITLTVGIRGSVRASRVPSKQNQG